MAHRTLALPAMLLLAVTPAALALGLPAGPLLDADGAEPRQYGQQQPPAQAPRASGASETSLVTFYGHVFGHTMNAPMPANTEAPIGEENYGIGSFDWCTSAVGEINCEADVSNKLALFTTAGFVDVESRAQWSQEGGYELLHNERGSTQDIHLDPSQHVTAGLYVSLDFHSWPVGNGYGTLCAYPHPPDVPCLYPYWGWDPGAQPDFVVEATLYHATLGAHGANASDQPPIREAWESGKATVVAQGRFGPETMTNGIPGSPNVNHFEIDLGPPQVDVIPRTDNLFLVYSVYSESSGTQWGIQSARWWAGELFPPTFTLPVKNAFSVERLTPVFAHGQLALLAILNTPWGSYDVDPDSVRLEIEGPGGPVTPEHIAEFADFSVAHGGHYIPINVTWVWDYGADGMPAGVYVATASARNFQGSALAACSAAFTFVPAERSIKPGPVQDGLCGEQTITEERLKELREEVEEG